MRALQLALLLSAACAGQTVDDLLATCPTRDEVAAIDKDLRLIFSADPTTADGFVCHAADGLTELTRFQARGYQTIRELQHIFFDKPLPPDRNHPRNLLTATRKPLRSTAPQRILLKPSNTNFFFEGQLDGTVISPAGFFISSVRWTRGICATNPPRQSFGTGEAKLTWFKSSLKK